LEVTVARPHIAIVSYPFAAFVNPTLPLVAVLIRRGYRVTYATTEPFARRVAQLGAELIPCQPISLDNVAEEPDPAAVAARFFPRLWEHIETAMSTLTRTYEQDRPVLLLYNNLALAGHILARRLGLRGVQLNATFALNQQGLHRQARDFRIRQSICESSGRLDGFIQRHDVASEGYLFSREKLNIYLFPRALQPLAESFDNSCFYAGRCAGEQPYYGDWPLENAAGRPIVLVSTSTMYVRGPDYFRMCIEALSGLEFHVLLSIGGSNDAASLGPLPSHFEVIQHTAHVRILPYASLFIYLGGSISTSEAMYHGVPLLVMSFGFAEIEWMGDILEDLGIGIHLKKAHMNAKAIRELAGQILSDSAMLNRLKLMKRAVRQDPGAEEAVNRIEDYAAQE
jgi:MGT family glycosyltransferase